MATLTRNCRSVIWEIHRYLWNEASSLEERRKDAVFFFKLIHPMSWSHRPKILSHYASCSYEIPQIDYCKMVSLFCICFCMHIYIYIYKTSNYIQCRITNMICWFLNSVCNSTWRNIHYPTLIINGVHICLIWEITLFEVRTSIMMSKFSQLVLHRNHT